MLRAELCQRRNPSKALRVGTDSVGFALVGGLWLLVKRTVVGRKHRENNMKTRIEDIFSQTIPVQTPKQTLLATINPKP